MLPNRKFRRKLILVTFVLLLLYLLSDVTINLIHRLRHPQHADKPNLPNLSEFLVDTPLCRIPKVDPYDPTIHHLVIKTDSRTCPYNFSLTYEEGLVLKINWTAVHQPPYNGSVKYCTYTPLYRPKYVPTDNNYLRYQDESDPFYDTVTITHDFVKATCYNEADKSVYINFHGFIQPNKTAATEYKKRFLEHVLNDKVTDPLNVIMIGMDSVSRLSFLRQMVKTKEFLTDTLEAVDLMGYNKVADNTFINIVPMTLGKFVSEMPWDESMTSKPFDDFNFIWKQFSEKGYTTLYAEDAPDIAIFDFLKAGFKTPPADYFNRPVSIAMETKSNLWFNNHHCFQSRLETQIVLDYVYNFAETFKKDPYFAFTFITRLSHDDVNSAGAADEPYFNFFSKLHKNDLLRNTVLFFFSDHGMRFGKIRETNIGKLEERLPFMYMFVPKWLKKSYPFLDKNFKTNQHRLSTPFDVYETLQDILYFNGKEKKADETSRGTSWFREIPNLRSCDKAGILPHWCTCLRYEKLDVKSDVVSQTSFVLLTEITKSLEKYTDICEKLSLHEVREATRLVESEEVLKNVRRKDATQGAVFGNRTKALEDIQVVIETVPGNALFEATVRMDTIHNSYTVVGDVSRINIYGHQSDCIDVFKLKKYCQCKGFT